MKPLLAMFLLSLVLLTSLKSHAQDETQLAVISFGWSRYVTALNTEPEWKTGRPTRQEQIDDRERQTIERGYGDLIRSRELRKIEHRAARSSVKESDWFLYKVKVRNPDAKTVKSIYWEYQIIDSANPTNPSRRQFFCSQKIKTNGVANFAALSPAMPIARTISAKAGRDAKDAFEEKVIINRVEYTDNSIWQREGWEFPNLLAEALSAYKRVPGDPACTTF